jgi:phage repressor protein C with HTH and peptisase S24 domain
MQASLSMKVAGTRSMFFPMGKLANRIKYIRKLAKLSQEKFAEALGTVDGVKVTRGAVGNWELGGGITRANLAAISDRFKVPLDWLEFGKGDLPQKPAAESGAKNPAAQNSISKMSNYDHNARIGDAIRGFGRIPIKGHSMGGSEGALIFNDQNYGDVLAPPSLVDVPDAYAVYVIGDSMLERFRHGEVVFVHPYAPVRKDDDCVVQIQSDDGTPPVGYVKRFISMDDDKLKLLQLNPKKVLTFSAAKVVAVHRIVMSGPA